MEKRERCLVFSGSLLLLWTLAMPAFSARTDKTDKTDKTDRTDRTDKVDKTDKTIEFPSAKLLMSDRLEQLDHDIAGLIMKRAETPAAGLAYLEMDIDLRITERWLLTQACAAKPESDMQILAFLRAHQLEQATANFDEALKQSAGQAPTITQAEGLKRLHQATFGFGDLENAPSPDAICHDVGAFLVLAANPTPSDSKRLPAMRPPKDPRQAPATREAATQPAGNSRTLTQLGDAASRAAVSQALRQELIALVARAVQLHAETSTDKESLATMKVLGDAVDTAQGLTGGGLPAQARDDIDSRLAEGLALFSDPRTRAAGQERVDSLTQYRQLVVRIDKLKITPEQRQKLAPAFTWVQANAESGAHVLDVMEKYLGQVKRYDALPKPNAAAQVLKKAMDDIRTQCDSQRDAFMAMAPALGATGAISSTPEGLESAGNDLKASIDIYELLLEMPGAIDMLQNTYKPKPFGVLEKHICACAAAAVMPTMKSPAKSEAMKVLNEVISLVKIATPEHSYVDIPVGVGQHYAGGQLAVVEQKFSALLAAAVSQFANGQDLDKAVMANLNGLRQLDAGLRLAARFEAALGNWDELQRWGDWQLTADQLRDAAIPYQTLLLAGYSGFASATRGPMDDFSKQSGRYAGLMKLVILDSSFATACSTLPGGLQGDLARLVSPMDGQPFALERYVSYAVPIMQATKEPEVADFIAAVIAKRLHERGISGRLDDLPPVAHGP